MTYNSGNAGMMYGGRFCKTFRTNYFVPYDAPIINACKNFDLTEVRRLFEAGLASPLDLNHTYNRTLVDIVVWHLVFGIHCEPSIQVGAAISLLKYLIHCLNDDIGAAHGIPDMFFFLRQHSYSKNAAAALEEACRILLIHCSDDPLEGLAEFLTIPASGSSLYQILVAQDIWWIDDKVEYKTSADVKYWVETDLQMLRDPGGNTLKAALKKGCVYRPHNSINKILVGETLHGLLVIASETMEEKFHHCIYSRLVIMIQHGLDPRGISFIQADYGLVPRQVKRTMRRPLSCTEYAQFLGLETLWARSLAGAGWSTADIDDLFEEDLVLATTSLLSGRIEYRTQDDNRRDFIQAVRLGKFADLEEETIHVLSFQFEFELGLRSYHVSGIIIEACSVFRERMTPGSWLDEENTVLMPGKDFQLPYNVLDDYQLKDWQCIREIWNNELGGNIPQGYAGSDYDWRTERWP